MAESARPPEARLPERPMRWSASVTFAPTLAAAQARIAAVWPAACALTRNALDGVVRIGVVLALFRHAWPWRKRRWHFVRTRMAGLTTLRWHGDSAAVGAALAAARRGRGIDEPHQAPWLDRPDAAR